MKKIFALFSLAAVCLLAGCSNLTYIFETDERLQNQTETGFEERFIMLDAKAAVYDGGYEIFEIPEDLDIGKIIAPIGDNSFIVTKKVFDMYNGHGLVGGGGGVIVPFEEYGIYTLGGEYRSLFPQYSDPMSETINKVSTILYCTEEYILYYTSEIKRDGSTARMKLDELRLLKLDDMTDKRIKAFESGEFLGNAIICGNAVYYEQDYPVTGVGAYEGEYSESVIIKYDIEKGELEKFCLNAGAPTIYKDKPAFYVGDGTFVSYAEPVFDPEEYGLTAKSLKLFPSDEMAYSYYSSTDDKNYTVMGYIKDGKQFNIMQANDSISVYDIGFADGCAVWECNFFDGMESKMFPMFYSDEKKSVIIIEDKRAYYDSFICNGKIFFIETENYHTEYKRVLVLDIENIK